VAPPAGERASSRRWRLRLAASWPLRLFHLSAISRMGISNPTATRLAQALYNICSLPVTPSCYSTILVDSSAFWLLAFCRILRRLPASAAGRLRSKIAKTELAPCDYSSRPSVVRCSSYSLFIMGNSSLEALRICRGPRSPALIIPCDG